MIARFSMVFMSLCLCPVCLAVDGLPESGNWFLQPLGWNGMFHENLQVSQGQVVWEGDYGGNFGTFFYDGTGVYSLLSCIKASVSEDSIVAEQSWGYGIRYLHQADMQTLDTSQPYDGDPDVYDSQVVWAAGSGYEDTNVYYAVPGDPLYSTPICLSCTAQCFNNGKSPVISSNTIAWLSNDGNDDEIFILKNYTLQQFTFNTVKETSLCVSDDGQLAWMTWRPDYEEMYGYVHYYDGQHVRQMTVGNTYSWLCGISEAGVLYTAENHPDYPDFERVLLLHNGTQETLINGTDGMIIRASIGGNSIAWINYEQSTNDCSMNFLKDQELIRWPLPDASMYEALMVGVWDNRVVWTPNESSLYFGEYLGGPACVNRPVMDGNNDCRVNLLDFAIFASEWLSCGYDDLGACQ